MGKTLVDLSLKRVYRWRTVTWKDAQHQLSLEKCKLKSQRAFCIRVRMAEIKY